MCDDRISAMNDEVVWPPVISGPPCRLASPQSTTRVSPRGAEHDVGGLQVAVQNLAAVREGDGVADAHKPIEELAEFERAHSVVEPAGSVERLDHAVKGFAADESHRVERPSVVALAQAVDRDDAWVFEASRDFGFDDEAGLALGTVGIVILNFLERDLAIELAVEGQEDLAEPASPMRPQDLKPLAALALALLFAAGIEPRLDRLKTDRGSRV